MCSAMPPAARHLDRLRARGGRVVVIDPRRTPTADRADLALQPVPGTDLALALGVLHLWDARRERAWEREDTASLARLYTARSVAGRRDAGRSGAATRGRAAGKRVQGSELMRTSLR